MFSLKPGKIKRLGLLAVLVAGALFFLYLVRGLLISLLLGALLAYTLKPAVIYLEKRGWLRVRAILFLYIIGLLFLIPTLLYVLPQLFRELNNFLDKLPEFNQEIQGWLKVFYERYQRPGMPLSFRRVVDETLVQLQVRVENGAREVVAFLLGLLSSFPSLALAPVLAYYFLRDREALSRGAIRLLPSTWREELLGLWGKIDRVLTSFVHGHLLISILVGILTGLGLFLAGSSYAVVLGIIMAMADLIPYFGPLLGAIPIVAISWLESRRLALYALLVVIAVQQIEAAVLAPRILSQSVELSPLAIILALLAGEELFGVAGLLLSVPALAIGRILIGFLWDKLVKR